MDKTIFDILGPHQNRVYGKDLFSCEIEVEFDDFVENFPLETKSFHIVGDGSLDGGHGREFISKVPLPCDDLVDRVRNLFRKGIFRHARKNCERTSIHIHENIQDWTKDELFTVLVTYYLVEHLLFNFCEDSRSSNLYCLSLSEAENGLKAVEDIWFETKERGMFERFKYAALNVVNVKRLGTLEYRHLEGTFDTQRFSDWLCLIRCVSDARNKFKNMGEVLKAFNKDRKEFVKTIFGKYAPLVFNPLSQADEEKLDLNYSPVVSIVDLPNRKPERIKPAYSFSSQNDLEERR